MGEAYFYHLIGISVEEALPALLRRALSLGWNVVIRGTDSARLDWLDARLWLGEPGAFLPHGRAGGPHDCRQPILLTTGNERPNAAACLMAIDGADVRLDEIRSMTRACILFDGHNDSATSRARDQWRTLTAAGCSAQYWSREGRSWQMKRRSGGLPPTSA